MFRISFDTFNHFLAVNRTPHHPPSSQRRLSHIYILHYSCRLCCWWSLLFTYKCYVGQYNVANSKKLHIYTLKRQTWVVVSTFECNRIMSLWCMAVNFVYVLVCDDCVTTRHSIWFVSLSTLVIYYVRFKHSTLCPIRFNTFIKNFFDQKKKKK